MLQRSLWLVIANVLLVLCPRPAVTVSPTYGAFPRVQGAGIVHVKKFVAGIRDGNSCETGFESINEGIATARARGALLVEVCDGEVYAETVIMADGISLVSKASGLLGAGFTYQDVLLHCGATGPEKFPTITPSSTVCVSAFGLTKRTVVSGFRIIGATAGGVSVRGCDDVVIVGNCIEGNSNDQNGGGIDAFNSLLVEISRNAIHDNEASGSGGGISSNIVSQLRTDGNLISHNKANKNGGGIYGAAGTLARHSKDDIFSNTAEDYGGGVYQERTTSITHVECQLVGNEALEQGGGGMNLFRTPAVDLQRCTFLSNKAGVNNPAPTSVVELLRVQPGGGGVRIEAGKLDILGGSFDTCTTPLDGGGVLYLSRIGLFFNENADELVSGSILNATVTNCSATDDGGNVSNQLGSQLTMSNVRLLRGFSILGRGGAYHASCASIATVSGGSVDRNDSGEDGGGFYLRDAVLTVPSSEMSVTNNTARRDGAGLTLASDHIPEFMTIDLDICDNEEAYAQVDSALFGGNVATRRAGAVAIKRFEGGRQMNFLFQNCTISDNFAADTNEAAVEVALTAQPQASKARSYFKDSVFRNRGVQLKGISRGTPIKNFYDIQSCVFFVDYGLAPGDTQAVGIAIEKDSPSMTNNHFVGPPAPAAARGGGITIRDPYVDKKIFPKILNSSFQNLSLGVLVTHTGAQAIPVDVDRSIFDGGACGVELFKSSADVSKTTFSNLVTGIRFRGGSSVKYKGQVQFLNVATPEDKIGN